MIFHTRKIALHSVRDKRQAIISKSLGYDTSRQKIKMVDVETIKQTVAQVSVEVGKATIERVNEENRRQMMGAGHRNA